MLSFYNGLISPSALFIDQINKAESNKYFIVLWHQYSREIIKDATIYL